MDEPFIGQIQMVGFNFAPRGWALCNGQLLPIAQNQALFALLGTTYGGDGLTTFALPNLQGRVPVHMGRLEGGDDIQLGETGGGGTVVAGPIGDRQPNTALQPFLGVNFIIALQGIFPTRD